MTSSARATSCCASSRSASRVRANSRARSVSTVQILFSCNQFIIRPFVLLRYYVTVTATWLSFTGVAVADVQGSAGIVSDEQATSPGPGGAQAQAGSGAGAGAPPVDALTKRTRLLRLSAQKSRRPYRFLPKSMSLCVQVGASSSPGPGQSADGGGPTQSQTAPPAAAQTQSDLNRIEARETPATPK